MVKRRCRTKYLSDVECVLSNRASRCVGVATKLDHVGDSEVLSACARAMPGAPSPQAALVA